MCPLRCCDPHTLEYIILVILNEYKVSISVETACGLASLLDRTKRYAFAMLLVYKLNRSVSPIPPLGVRQARHGDLM